MGIAPTPDPLEQHFKSVTKAIIDGRLVPFLGAGINMCGRPAGVEWQPGQFDYLPNGRELSVHLQQSFGTPADQAGDLSRISEYVSVMNGDGPLYEELRKIFDGSYPPTAAHRFLATLARGLGEKGYPRRHLLVVTTNYDDVLEQAFLDAGEDFDLLTYIASGEDCGRFAHWRPGSAPQTILIPNEYAELSLERRSIILKIHGDVDRSNAERDSYVITEDHYIDYLKHTEISSLVPAIVAAKLRRSNFLFWATDSGIGICESFCIVFPASRSIPTNPGRFF